jgi:integral membrane protein (TIGR00529 family)
LLRRLRRRAGLYARRAGTEPFYQAVFMPEFSASTIAFGKLILTFGCIMLLLRFKVTLWITIFAGCGVIALLCGLPPLQWLSIPLATVVQGDFLILEIMVFGIMVLSGLQNASGQSKRLVNSLEQRISSPHIRLIFFPALIGLLPMPGGALFSCPMLEETAHDLNLTPERKSLINYWFRHMWELSWPLYPGYVLASSLLGVSLVVILKYTFPLVICYVLTGWFFLLRDIRLPAPKTPPVENNNPGARTAALKTIFYESLPLTTTLLGAAVFGFILNRAAPGTPSQLAFVLSVGCGIAVALAQGHNKLSSPLIRIFFNWNVFKLLLLMYAIFVFKDVVGATGLVTDMSRIGDNKAIVLALFILLPLACSLLTGIMVGYVGTCFPILIGIIAESSLHEYTVPLIVLALLAGNAGMLLTPLHACLALTCDFFKTSYAEIWRKLLSLVSAEMAYGIVWCFLLMLFGARFTY